MRGDVGGERNAGGFKKDFSLKFDCPATFSSSSEKPWETGRGQEHSQPAAESYLDGSAESTVKVSGLESAFNVMVTS